MRWPAYNKVWAQVRISLQDPKSADENGRSRRDAGRARNVYNAQNIPWLTDGTANWFWAAAEKAELPVMCLTPGRKLGDRSGARSSTFAWRTATGRPWKQYCAISKSLVPGRAGPPKASERRVSVIVAARVAASRTGRARQAAGQAVPHPPSDRAPPRCCHSTT
jgi:hypothetical protein